MGFEARGVCPPAAACPLMANTVISCHDNDLEPKPGGPAAPGGTRSQGEDVVITVEGKPKARLTRAEPPASRALSQAELRQWMAELAEFRGKTSTGKQGLTVEQILAEDRGDRL